MKMEEFKHWMNEIQKGFSKQYPVEALQRLWQKVKEHPGEAMEAAFDSLVMGSNYLPTAQNVADAVNRESVKIKQQQTAAREAEAKAEKEAYRKGQDKAFGQNSGIARDACILIRAALAGKITRSQFLEGHKHLDVKYPDAGFAAVGGRMKESWKRRNLDFERELSSQW